MDFSWSQSCLSQWPSLRSLCLAWFNTLLRENLPSKASHSPIVQKQTNPAEKHACTHGILQASRVVLWTSQCVNSQYLLLSESSPILLVLILFHSAENPSWSFLCLRLLFILWQPAYFLCIPFLKPTDHTLVSISFTIILPSNAVCYFIFPTKSGMCHLKMDICFPFQMSHP